MYESAGAVGLIYFPTMVELLWHLCVPCVARYQMAFSIDDRPARRTEKMMPQPRYMVKQSIVCIPFEKMANSEIE